MQTISRLSYVNAPGVRRNTEPAFRSNRMARFYFDVRDGTRFAPDDEGTEFDSRDAAEREGAEAAAEIGRDRLPKGDTRAVTVEVRNEQGHRVLIVNVSMEVDRLEPPPASSRA
jgi:hypothetical protein